MVSVKIVNLKLKTIPRSFQICQKIKYKDDLINRIFEIWTKKSRFEFFSYVNFTFVTGFVMRENSPGETVVVEIEEMQ